MIATPKTILVTGATGFIGSHLVSSLLASGNTVCAIVRSGSDTWRISQLLAHPKLKICSDNIGDIENLFSQQKVDCVAHLAAKYYKQHNTPIEAKEIIDSNVLFPVTLLDIMKKYEVKKIVTAGSFFEYDLSGNKILNENSDIKPYNLYARTKLVFSDVISDYAGWHGFSGVHLRLFSAYGPRDNEKLFSYLIKNFLNKQLIHLTPSQQQWNFTYVGDIVDAFTRAIEFCLNAKPGLEVFNIGQTNAVAIKSIVGILERQLSVSGLVSFDRPYPANEIFYVACDGAKAREQLGWAAKVDIDEGLKQTINYLRNN